MSDITGSIVHAPRLCDDEGKLMGKLVRDAIPEIIAAEGRTPNVRILDGDAYESALHDKLLEEARELRSSQPEDRLGEAADVHEVLLAILELQGLGSGDLEAAAAEKRQTHGAFTRRIWWEPEA